MCSRYSFSDDLDELIRVLRVEPIPLEPRYNVSPLSGAPVVVQRQGEAPCIEQMQWGLVPWWARDDSGAAKMTTAPSETVAERPAQPAARTIKQPITMGVIVRRRCPAPPAQPSRRCRPSRR